MILTGPEESAGLRRIPQGETNFWHSGTVCGMEHDSLKLFGEATEFVFVVGVFDAHQAEVQRLPYV